MQIDKAIAYFESEVRFCERAPAGNLAHQTLDWVRVMEASRTALEALREKKARENPQPLTREELLQLEGEPVWAVHNFYGAEWVVIRWDRASTVATAYKTCLRACDYGDAWVAYRHKPEEVTA